MSTAIVAPVPTSNTIQMIQGTEPRMVAWNFQIRWCLTTMLLLTSLRSPNLFLITHARTDEQADHMKTPTELDRITDAVLAYKPKPKTKAAKRRKRKALRDAKKG